MNGLEAFRLLAKLTLDKTEYEKGMTDAEQEAYAKGQKIGTGLSKAGSMVGSALGAMGTAMKNLTIVAGKMAIAGIGASATAISGLVVTSSKAYANFEQLSGGIQKLYGNMGMSLQEYADANGKTVDEVRGQWQALEDAQDQVAANAGNAWLTVGMDANQYMESITGFSAALLNATDSSVEAANLADVAMKDIADNANTFGKYTAEELTSVYQALAKGQYQTLDNLNLGYGGSKEGMQSLIDKANELAKAQGEMGDLTIDSYADIVKAIHLVQEDMNIAGTTEREAMKTMEGSLNATKSAWTNLTLAIGKGEGISEAIDNISTAIFGLEGDTENETGLINQIVPRIQTTMESIGEVVAQAGPILADKLPLLMDSILPTLLTSTQTLVSSLVGALPGIIDTLLAYVPQLLDMIVDTGLQIIPMILSLLVTLGGKIIAYFPTLFAKVANALPDLFKGLADSLTGAFDGDILSAIINGAVDMIMSLVSTLAEYLPTAIDTFTQGLVTLAETLTNPDMLGKIIEGGVQLLLSLADGLIQAIPQLIEAIPVIIENLVTALVNNLPLLIDAGIQLIGALAQAIIENLPLIVAAAIKIIYSLVDGLIGALPELVFAGWNLMTELLGSIIEALPKFLENGIKVVGAVVEGIIKTVGSIVKAGISLVTNFINAIAGTFGRIRDAGKQVIDTVKNGIMDKINDAKTWGKDLIQNFIDGILAKWEALKSTVSNVAQSVKDFIGFSEPKKGPLSNFHTYAPDMMELFAKGIKDNEDLITGQISKSFDFGTSLVAMNAPQGGTGIGGVTFTQNIYSPEALTPYEIARQTRNANQELVLSLRGV